MADENIVSYEEELKMIFKNIVRQHNIIEATRNLHHPN